MTLLSKLKSAFSAHGLKTQSAISWRILLTPIGVADPSCPHCGHVFEKMPQRKRACPTCSQVLYSRKRPLDGVKVLLTEQQALETEGQSFLLVMAQEGLKDAELDAIVRGLGDDLGRTPTAEDVVVRQLGLAAEEHAKLWQWGLYRNARFNLGESCVRRGLREEALRLYLEVCLLDLNGPRNCGTQDPSVLHRFPPFDPSTAFLAPGVTARVNDLAAELHLSAAGIQQLFEDLASSVGPALALPRPALDAWRELAQAVAPRT